MAHVPLLGGVRIEIELYSILAVGAWLCRGMAASFAGAAERRRSAGRVHGGHRSLPLTSTRLRGGVCGLGYKEDVC